MNWRGLWTDNPAVVQLLGLCPLLAVSTSATAGLGLGLATLMTLVLASAAVSSVRTYVPSPVRLPAFVMIIAGVVSVIDLLGEAYLFELHQRIGLFVPLIVTNCLVLARMETVASKHPVVHAVGDGAVMGLGFAWALVLLGAVREFVGTGCIFRDAAMLFGPSAASLGGCGFDGGLLIAIMPPGAFFGLAGIVLVHRFIQRARDRRLNAPDDGAHSVAGKSDTTRGGTG